MSRTIALSGSQLVTLNGSGNGQTPPVGPTHPGESWQIEGSSVQATTFVNDAQAAVYIAPAGPFAIGLATLLGATSTGSSGDSFGPARSFEVGQQITAIWTGGDPGAVATLAYWGTRRVP